MRRVQVRLTDDEARHLDQLATSSGRSVGSVISEVVSDWLARDERRAHAQRAATSLGGFRSGLHDVAENHDRYLNDDGPADESLR